MKYALISVFDKTGIEELAREIMKADYQIISTGGTAKTLTKAGIKVVPIEKITNSPESFDGRMKTISFQIEGGILFDRSNKEHADQAKKLNIPQIDIVVCNFYPFEQTVAKNSKDEINVIESIDVGGPTMVRAAAKNFKHVLVVTDPNDYQKVIQALKSENLDKLRKDFAGKAFWHLSYYDSMVADYLSNETFPSEITLTGKKLLDLRYGENPHQKAALYHSPKDYSPFSSLQKHWGRDLSLTNVSDINSGYYSASFFTKPCAVVIKHNSPCGIALGEKIEDALFRAVESDPESAFGGVIVLNREISQKCADIIASFKQMRRGNIDILVGTEIEGGVLKLLQKVRKSMGIYTYKLSDKSKSPYNFKWIEGGFVLQTRDSNIEQSFRNWKVVTKKIPSEKQIEQMKIAWKFISSIRSNAVIVVDRDLPMTRGIGSGQTSRVRSTKIALEQAAKFSENAILASDSFFPFDDSALLANKAGISAIVQQGGSINDQKVIETADRLGIIMVFTGRRAFWH